MKQRWILSISVAVALGFGLVATASAGELRAGAAKVSITPTADEFPYVVPREKNFVGVHDEVYARAQAAGGAIVRPIEDMPYGSREFTVKDPEGHSWSVGTYDPWAAHS